MDQRSCFKLTGHMDVCLTERASVSFPFRKNRTQFFSDPENGILHRFLALAEFFGYGLCRHTRIVCPPDFVLEIGEVLPDEGSQLFGVLSLDDLFRGICTGSAGLPVSGIGERQGSAGVGPCDPAQFAPQGVLHADLGIVSETDFAEERVVCPDGAEEGEKRLLR